MEKHIQIGPYEFLVRTERVDPHNAPISGNSWEDAIDFPGIEAIFAYIGPQWPEGLKTAVGNFFQPPSLPNDDRYRLHVEGIDLPEYPASVSEYALVGWIRRFHGPTRSGCEHDAGKWLAECESVIRTIHAKREERLALRAGTIATWERT